MGFMPVCRIAGRFAKRNFAVPGSEHFVGEELNNEVKSFFHTLLKL